MTDIQMQMHLTVSSILQSVKYVLTVSEICSLSFNHVAELKTGRTDANVCRGKMCISQEGGFEKSCVKIKKLTLTKVILLSSHMKKSISIFLLLQAEDSLITWASQQYINVVKSQMLIKTSCIKFVLKHAESCHIAEILNSQAVQR